MIVCQCNGVSDRAIQDLIRDGASNIAEITRRCGAGRCPPCRAELQAMLSIRACAAEGCACAA